MGLIIIAGIGIFSFLLVLLFFKLGEVKPNGSNHFLLQLLVFGFIIGTFILLGKATLDAQNSEFCSWNVVNSTDINGSFSTYGYDYQCVTPTETTALTFYKVILWFVRVAAVYLFLYFCYEVMNYFNFFGKNKND